MQIPAEYYLPVFNGDIDCPKTLAGSQEERRMVILEHVFRIFNTNPPAGYCGRSLSVSDVVQLEDKHFLCSVIGFVPATLQASETETTVPELSACELTLPSGIRLWAKAYQESEYLCINKSDARRSKRETVLCGPSPF